ncbi:BTAD domain-containing putative transcriptional regulator [Bacillus litorisediminis]|uniref:BTAD domain-containing putative transcriptional regulator n=1 Tax=Bacillus litorisediminis TaxID=2922713 RepID=UPI001FADAF17|nr:BTAD domain-containing putative transcriptional regulator [Bacillus litorisediminis]
MNQMIVQTKLMPPQVRPNYIRRASLFKKMKAISAYSVTILTSGAGYGKSTALSLYVRDEKVACSWYTITSHDDDILPFIDYIIYSVKRLFPDFGKDLKEYMQEMDRYIREEELFTLCSIFVNEIYRLDTPLILILDDFHHTEGSYLIQKWVELVIEHIPESLHLVLSTRTRPNWSVLTKLKVNGQLLDIGETDLKLSQEEVELLLVDYHELHVAEEDIAHIYRITEGWVIAVSMIAENLKFERMESQKIHSSQTSLQDLFQYLALEVFSKQPPMLQQFLEQTAVFDEISADLCEEVLGLTGAKAMLSQLSQKSLFLHADSEGTYRYHALFREFLQEQLYTNQPRQYHILHERSARYYERNGEYEKAIRIYDKIGQDFAVAAILQEHGSQMLKEGKLESLYEFLKKLPDSEKDRYYKLWFYEGEILRYRSRYAAAEKCYAQAEKMAIQTKDFEHACLALEGWAQIYLDTIQPRMAERILNEAIQLRESTNQSLGDSSRNLYWLMAENYINAGEAGRAEVWYSKGEKAIQEEEKEDLLLARIYLRTGRLSEAKKLLEHKPAKQSSDKKLPQSHREAVLLLSLIEGLMGNALRSKELAQAGIQLGIQSKSPFVEACGWIRMGHAVQLLEDYDIGLSVQCYETALDMMEQMNISRGKAEPYMGLCLLYGSLGEFDRARDMGTKALYETENVKDVWLSSLIQLGLGICAYYERDFKKAYFQFEKALAYFIQCQDQFGEMISRLWIALAAFETEQKASLKMALSSFLATCELKGYQFVFLSRTLFGPKDPQMLVPLLLEAQKLGIHKEFVSKILSELGYKDLDSHPGYTLKVRTLGSFKVFLGDQEVEEKEWQRGKAKELFELFITHRTKVIEKDEIVANLWPDYDTERASRDFKVVLNALNNVLQPKRMKRSQPFYVIRQGSAYGLNPEAKIWVDTDYFQDWIQAGLEEKDVNKAREFLQRGLTFYKGEYIPERRFEDWCIQERERLLTLYLRGAEKLAQLFVKVEDFDQAIFYCEQILQKDRTWEEAYRLLMYSYYRKNNRPQALKWYKRCVDVLKMEFGVEPLDATKQMYEIIQSN